MKKRLFHIAPYLFLAFLLLPFLCMLFLQGAQFYLKAKAGERMEREKVITITIPAQTAQWEKKDKELVIQGRMFDVKSYSVSNALLTATGFYDDQETGLAALLSSLPHDKKGNVLLHLFLVLQCLSIAVLLHLFAGFFRRSTTLYFFISFFLPQLHLLVLKQPPRC